jgi:hypothetical protein
MPNYLKMPKKALDSASGARLGECRYARLDKESSSRAGARSEGGVGDDSEDVPGFVLDLPMLLSYHALFFALPPAIDQGILITYVQQQRQRVHQQRHWCRPSSW